MAAVNSYTLASAAAVVAVVLLELVVLRTRMFADPRYWLTLAVLAVFQILVDGLLTRAPIVTYNARAILGLRIWHEPVEDLGFGFALLTMTIGLWRRLGEGPDGPT